MAGAVEDSRDPAGKADGAPNGSALAFRFFVDGVTDYAIYMLDARGFVSGWNAGAARMKGYTAPEILGRHFSVFYTEEDRAQCVPEHALATAEASGCYAGGGIRVRKDGSCFWASVTIQPIRDEQGTLIGFAKITRDLTEPRQTEASWVEERFRRVVEAAPNAMVMINAAGRIEMVNLQAELVFGYPRTELLGQPMEMLVPERFRGHHPGLRTAFFAAPASRPMGAGRDLYGLRKDGTEFPVEIGLNPIETDEGPMVLSAIVDISARKRLEERFRRVVEAAPNAMVMIDAAGRIKMVNAQAESVFGYPRAELLGRPVEMLVPERFGGHHPGLRTAFFASPASRPMGAGRDLYGLRKDGTEFPVEIGLNPIETEEGPMVLSAVVDISDRKNKEDRIQAALKEKEVLLGEIHHRVKNNMTIIYSLLELQIARVTDATVINTLRDSQNRVKSMALIHQTLYQSHDFAQVDFRRFLESLCPTLLISYAVNPEHINLVITAAEVALPIDTAIPCGLIVNELISNALKHAFPAGRHGEIRIDLAQNADQQVILSVSDDGVGIPAALDIEASDTLGMQLVNLLTGQLGGTIAIQRANPTRSVLQFALKR